MPTALILVNPAAGRARSRGALVTSAAGVLRRDGFQVEVRATTGPGHALEMAAASCVDRVVVGGGDGTLNEVATGLLRSGNPSPRLSILPMGTGNDVARLQGVGTPEAALASLAGGVWDPWDVLEVCCRRDGAPLHRHALLFAGVGFVGDVIRQTTPGVKAWFGSTASYAVGFFRALACLRSGVLRVSGPGFVREGPMLAALAANASHAGGGGMHLGPGARVDDGLLDVSLIDSLGRGAVALQFLRLIRGTHVRHRAVRYFPAGWLEVDAPLPVVVAADGDCIGHTPARFEVRPGALRIGGRRR